MFILRLLKLLYLDYCRTCIIATVRLCSPTEQCSICGSSCSYLANADEVCWPALTTPELHSDIRKEELEDRQLHNFFVCLFFF